MRVLVYKQTHIGDPDANGRFGVHDCMGKVRAWDYEAVIGVGGIGREPKACGIAGKVTWIGIGARKRDVGLNGPDVTFDHYRRFGRSGPLFRTVAPVLAGRMYDRNIRSILHSLTEREKAEVAEIVQLASDAPPSAARALPSKRAVPIRLRHPRRCSRAACRIG